VVRIALHHLLEFARGHLVAARVEVIQRAFISLLERRSLSRSGQARSGLLLAIGGHPLLPVGWSTRRLLGLAGRTSVRTRTRISPGQRRRLDILQLRLHGLRGL